MTEVGLPGSLGVVFFGCGSAGVAGGGSVFVGTGGCEGFDRFAGVIAGGSAALEACSESMMADCSRDNSQLSLNTESLIFSKHKISVSFFQLLYSIKGGPLSSAANT